MDHIREKRKKDINKALAFIQSSLAYPEPDSYQVFLIQLVCNLLDEGKALFQDSDWEEAVKEFSEGLNVSQYASTEGIQIPEVLLESLYVNRATAYHNIGDFDRGVKDCDDALEVCKESHTALYRKALCLKALGKYKEAYNCITDCLLITRVDEQVNELAQELAVHLGLKTRKPYVSAKESAAPLGNGLNPLRGIAPVNFPSVPHSSVPAITSNICQPALSVPDSLDAVEDSELIGDDLDSLLDCFPNEQNPMVSRIQEISIPGRTSNGAHTVSLVLPAPTPQLPPAFFSSSVSQLNSLDSLSRGGCITLDALDDLSSPHGLDALDNFSSGGVAAPNLGLSFAPLEALDGLDTLDDFLGTSVDAAEEVNKSKTELEAEEKSLDDLLDELGPLEMIPDVPKIAAFRVDQLDSLDTLDSFPSVEGGRAALPTLSVGGIAGSHSVAPGSLKNNNKMNDLALVSFSNPLSTTHEFMEACPACFPREGEGIYTFVHKPNLVHTCERDILLCRRRAGVCSEWTRVRQTPTWTSFTGPFVLCRELLKSGDLGLCKYGEKCSFAFNQLEIDVWTEERKGTLDRNLLFDTAAVKLDPVNSIIRLLQEHKGLFIFLCQECYDSKPRIISERCKDNHTICSNMDVVHNFDANKCLVFVVRFTHVKYTKVRPLSVMCHLNLCHPAIRYSCLKEDSCLSAHSPIELKTWRLQQDTGISRDEIVKVSSRYQQMQEQNLNKHRTNRLSAGGKPIGEKNLNMKMKFACAQCWRTGLLSEPDKALKYCTAKAKHTWTKERRLLLVKSLERSKWVQVRPLPHAKNLPLYYDLCNQFFEKRKCKYGENCTFAHSQEEKEMWMYMKNNDLRVMQQIYDTWLTTLTTNNPQTDGALLTQRVQGEKYIVMPTDNAEPMSGFHCRLCGKHSNSQRQWKQHISSEKHKDRVFSCEGEDEPLTWSYRFPGPRFELCSRFDCGCPDGVSCDYAHSPEELQEWTKRRDFLRQTLAKAREDELIMPDEFNFGKYSFLLQD